MFQIITGVYFYRLIEDFYEMFDINIGHSFGEQGVDVILLFQGEIDEGVDESADWGV